MKLDRNQPGGKDKYAVVRLRTVRLTDPTDPCTAALGTLARSGVLDWGLPGEENEFFVIKLRNKYAAAALAAYADAAHGHDPEYADQVRALIKRAGPNSEYCKVPD